MNNLDSVLFITQILTGPIFLITGWILRRFPPKSINSLYGYRTPRSMKNKENWDFSQTYAANLMMQCGGFMLAIAIIYLLSPITLNMAIDFSLSMGIIILVCIVLIIKTERALKKFEKNQE